MGWIIVVALALAIWLLLWRFGRVPRLSYELIGAALLLGLAGYAWQGHPGQIGSPVQARADTANIDPKLIEQRKAMMGQFGTEAQWLDTADTYGRLGSTRAAVTVMRGAVHAYPKSADLWVGLGNALVAHGDGMISPAAQYAFQKAAQLSPEHPGPPFFMGLALAQSGQLDKAETLWSELLAQTPADAPWRADLEAKLGMLRAQMGVVSPTLAQPQGE
ncbi:tetratricopeptide repeat protein [Sphingomonas cavernae]|uniref:Cytochrome C biogenesis protein n=1 Tax=Sphingomonas cavernae TaxID=2320861 RepID=A0A418WNW4_9SPHN|nr:tetratricopeptide repeat protein [Sphingomonas cavernae]RJF92924.1 cytochrome C biogenesis protein [Sphingomonas cavernae]